MVEAEKKKEVFTQTRRERNYFLFQKGGEAREGERHSLWAVAAAVAAVRRRRAETATPFAGERNNDEPQQWRRRLRRRGARRAPRDLRRGEGGAVGGVLGGRGGARGGGADGWRM